MLGPMGGDDAETELARRRHEYLHEISARLHELRLDARERLAALVRFAVPEVADWCLVDLIERGALVRAAEGHWDEERRTGHLGKARPIAAAARRGPSVVVATGAPYIELEVGEGGADGGDVIDAELRGELGAVSYVAVPLRVSREVIGVVTFAFAESVRRYDPSYLTLALELGHRAAVAVESARLFQDAERALRSRDDMLAVVTHDLRGPLAVVSMGASAIRVGLLSGAPPLDKLVARVDSIERAARDMDRLIRMLLDAARIDAGLLAVAPQPELLPGVVDDVLQSLRPLAERRRIDLIDELACEQLVWVDRELISRTLTNLVSNAIRFTPDGGKVVVSAACDPGGATISVSDTGPGVPAEHVPHLFDRFWQAPDQTRKGSGLGLYIARAIVEAHGGRIWYAADPGQSARFTFTLPGERSTSA